jgi:hypothetical protein
MIVNFRLLKHPMNYLVVTLMLVLAGIAGHLVLQWIGLEPAVSNGPQTEQQTPTTTPVALRSDGAFQAISVGA